LPSPSPLLSWGMGLGSEVVALSTESMNCLSRVPPRKTSFSQPEEHFSRFDDEQYALRYLTKPRRARHHMRWSLGEEGDMNFFDFMRRFVREFPQTKDSILGRLQFTEAALRARLGGLPSIPVDEGCRLTPRRLDFTLTLVMKRAALLRRALEND
jgi:hypothetical protein